MTTTDRHTETTKAPVTSVTWWNQTKRSPDTLAHWLRSQLRGETTACARIKDLRDQYCAEGSRQYRLLTVIAEQEHLHATWMEQLLIARGISTDVGTTQERYWKQTLGKSKNLSLDLNFDTGCAVGAHAEKMRLERIEAIANDPEAPEDIRTVFAKILPQERFHERAFRELTTPEALERTKDAHQLGRKALGLVA